VEYVKKGELSFKHVVTFNMDEYVGASASSSSRTFASCLLPTSGLLRTFSFEGLSREHPESYWAFMHRHLFDHIDIPKQNINILNGNAPDLVSPLLSFLNPPGPDFAFARLRSTLLRVVVPRALQNTNEGGGVQGLRGENRQHRRNPSLLGRDWH
jgi:hypothetical protein